MFHKKQMICINGIKKTKNRTVITKICEIQDIRCYFYLAVGTYTEAALGHIFKAPLNTQTLIDTKNIVLATHLQQF